ncbi:MAG: malto-oligosyltrehalose synthase, partial [Gemmatimonadota bacterium]|nr:malto-oligosyltrehalose synthase [Gemmatimonadota bacterium]
MPDSIMPIPGATYRLQFNQNFTFRDATHIVPYLHELGISDLYASPYLRARPGSLHGYDVFDHGALNPEIGSESEHAAMSRALAQHGMGQVVDIVPNHMGIAAGENRWWTDVLENGPSSPYAPFFDIDWEPLQPELAGKVLLPILGDPFGRVLERGELRLAYEDGHFRVEYFEHRLPASPGSGVLVLRAALDGLGLPEDHPDHMELASIVVALERLPPRSSTDAASIAERRREKAVTERRVRALHQSSDSFRDALRRAVDLFNGTPGDPASFDRLDALLDNQAYRLAFWRVAAEEINYRRFFDINDLAGLRMERGEVFDATHELVLRWLAEGKVTGLRIDHPDGLFDPRGYLRRLDHEATERSPDGPRPIWVEKILTGDEPLPDEWPVAGTVGYEFLNRVNGLFVATRNQDALDSIYRGFVGHMPRYRELVIDRKRLILRTAMVSELNVLAYLLDRLANQSRHSRDFTLGSLTHALRETIAAFPVYRTYIDAVAGRVSESDRGHVREAVRVAKRLNRTAPAAVFDFIGSTLLLEWPEQLDDHSRSEHARFVMKFQQLTGPAMAKGAEDTAFYTYNRLISLNEVGGEPDRFGVSPEEFHQWIAERAASWPRAMNTSSTHDTKRSEDVRARINVLSEIPDAWATRVRRWSEMNAAHKSEDDGNTIPDANDEYLLYQTLLGAWP